MTDDLLLTKGMTEKPGADWKRWYRALKAFDPEAYSAAIRYAEGCSLNFHLPLDQAAEIERSHVMLACKLLEVTP